MGLEFKLGSAPPAFMLPLPFATFYDEYFKAISGSMLVT